MLSRQVNFHIRIPVIRVLMGSRRLPVDRNALPALSPLQLSDQLFHFLPDIHPPAVIACINGHCFPIAGLKFSPVKDGVMPFSQRRDILFDRFPVKLRFLSIQHNPARHRIRIQRFPLCSKGIGNSRIRIIAQLFIGLFQFRIFRGNVGFLIASRRIQINLFPDRSPPPLWPPWFSPG